MKKEDVKVIKNVIIIAVLAVPCCLVMCDGLWMKCAGVIYGYQYWRNILRPVWMRYRELVDSREG